MILLIFAGVLALISGFSPEDATGLWRLVYFTLGTAIVLVLHEIRDAIEKDRK